MIEGERVHYREIHLPDFPLRKDNVRDVGILTARQLVAHPVLLPEFIRRSEEHLLTIQASRDTGLSAITDRFMATVGREVAGTDWNKKREEEIDDQTAVALLETLHSIKNSPTRRLSLHLQITQDIVRGYVNDRFEDRKDPDWRGAISVLHKLLEVSVLPEPDLEKIATWFDLLMGDYKGVMPRYSLAWRSYYVAARAIGTYDEPYFLKAMEIDHCQGLIDTILGTHQRSKENSQAFLAYNLQVSTILTLLNNHIDPSTERGRKAYKDILRAAARKGELASDYSLDVIQAAIGLPFTPDVFEQVHVMSSFPQRYAGLTVYLNRNYEQFMGEDSYNFSQGAVGSDIEKFPFPYNLLHGRNFPIQEALYTLLDQGSKHNAVSRLVKVFLDDRGEGYTAAPFYLRGLSGQAVIPVEYADSPAHATDYVDQLMQTNEIMSVEQVRAMLANANPSVVANLPEASIIFTRDEFAPKSPLEALLDLNIPPELVDQSIKLLKENFKLRRELAGQITRIPTLVGDRYDLVDHPDLPGVIRGAVLRKSVEEGLQFTIDLLTDERIYPDDPRLTGSINFAGGRVNIFLDSQEDLAVHQRWIMERCLIRLVQKSCCPPLQEVILEREEAGRQGISLRSIPGYIGHTGGLRADGTPKQFTRYAEGNFQSALNNLLFDVPGVSLAEINRHHRTDLTRQGMNDQRFLTYYRGRDTNFPQEPTLRSNPEHLI